MQMALPGSRKFSFYLTVRVRRYLEQRLAEKRSKPEAKELEFWKNPSAKSQPFMNSFWIEWGFLYPKTVFLGVSEAAKKTATSIS